MEHPEKLPLKVTFINPQEIRMGSPYNVCKIGLEGKHNIKLGALEDWQDKYAFIDSKHVVFIKYDVAGNNPGFHFVTFNLDTGARWESERIEGLLNNFDVYDKEIKYNKFFYQKGLAATDQNSNNTLTIFLP